MCLEARSGIVEEEEGKEFMEMKLALTDQSSRLVVMIAGIYGRLVDPDQSFLKAKALTPL